HLPGRPPHREAGGDRGARGHPLRRGHRADAAGRRAMSAVASMSFFAAAYGLFLAVAALGLDVLARHSHRRAELYRTAGFTFHARLDAWECPEGERLHRVETDVQQRLARYRARAKVCNQCPRKGDCTDSDTGREVTRTLDPWPHSEAGRFHRVI